MGCLCFPGRSHLKWEEKFLKLNVAPWKYVVDGISCVCPESGFTYMSDFFSSYKDNPSIHPSNMYF